MEPAASDSAPLQEQNQELSDRQHIEMILDNLKRMEADDFPIADIDADRVKRLLGNLYMELLFPHDDEYTFIDMADDGEKSSFDQKT